jgi:hypothetical protein
VSVLDGILRMRSRSWSHAYVCECRVCVSPSIVARQRLGKSPLIVARQRLGKIRLSLLSKFLRILHGTCTHLWGARWAPGQDGHSGNEEKPLPMGLGKTTSLYELRE